MNRILVGLAMVAWSAAASAQAPATAAPANAGDVYAVSYVEVATSNARSASTLLKEYRDASRADAGHVGIEVLQQSGRPDHFVVLEAWQSQQAFDTHRTAAHTQTLLDRLQPLRVSPVDQRLYKGLAVGEPSGEPSQTTVYVVPTSTRFQVRRVMPPAF